MFEPQNNTFEASGITSLEKHTARTFGWMTLGIAVTAVVAYVLANTEFGLRIVFNLLFDSQLNYRSYMPMVMLVVQLGLVFALVGRLHKISTGAAKALFLAYSVITGFTFSTILLVYDFGDVAIAFGVTAIYFAALTFIGYTTKMNLSKIAPVLFVGLGILFIFNIISMFTGFAADSRLICSLGLIVFTGITAYDTQKMKALYMANQGNEQMLQKLSIYSAFDLYLDFINIFLYILQILNKRSN